ncbi:MAG: YdcF family protein, partial [Acidimicrobiales bacterium]
MAAALVGLAVLYVGITFVQVWQASRDDQAGPVDAIVVLGAAQYDGRPSPVLEARLRAAFELYEQGHASVIVTTGSNQEGDRFTQGFAGFSFL